MPILKVSNIRKSKFAELTLKLINAFNPMLIIFKINVGVNIKEIKAHIIINEKSKVNSGKSKRFVKNPTIEKYPKYFAKNGRVASCVAVVSANTEVMIFSLVLFIVSLFASVIIPNMHPKLKQKPILNKSSGFKSNIIIPLNPSMFSASGLFLVKKEK